MKNAPAYGKKFDALLRRLKKTFKSEPKPQRDPITQLVLSFLEWNSTTRAAELAYEKLLTIVVDNNDLRVSHPPEVVQIIGSDYPNAEERTARLHDALQEIFSREHALAIDSIVSKPKKDIRTYLDSLPGMTPYVAAAVLLSMGGHAIPVDDQLLEALKRESVIDPDATVEEVESFLERRVRAGEAVEAHQCLKAWAATRVRRLQPAKPVPAVVTNPASKPAAPTKPPASAKAASTAKTTKKTTKKTSKKPTKKTTRQPKKTTKRKTHK